MEFAFTPAERKKARLRLAIASPSGGGKTMGALLIAKALGGSIAVIDTERGSASLYATSMRLKDGSMFEPPKFDTLELLPPYTPERFIGALKAAAAAGYDNVIVDSGSHEWSGSGGCLDINEAIAKAQFQGNTWSAWSVTTPRHRAYLDALVGYPGHVICTLRSKTETAQEKNGAGKSKVIKLGMKAEQRDGIEYEFTVVLDLVHDGHYATASKDRTGVFTGSDPTPISEETGKKLLAWLESGAEPAPEPEPPEDYTAAQTSALNACETLDALRARWTTIAAACRESGDRPAYDALLKARDVRAASLAPQTAGAGA